MTRRQIVAIAKSSVGSNYLWGGEAWDPLDRRYLGADCSGLVVKAWQLMGPAELDEDVEFRPTTYTLMHRDPRWFAVAPEDRQPGDVFVRHDSWVRHAAIYVADDLDFSNNRKIWVIEAPEEKTKIVHHPVKLIDYSRYELRRRSNLDSIGLVGYGKTTFHPNFATAFSQMGGEPQLGTPTDRGRGILVSQRGSAFVQDFSGGAGGEMMLIGAGDGSSVFAVSRPIADAYWSLGGPEGHLGLPVADSVWTRQELVWRVSQEFEGGSLESEVEAQPPLGRAPVTSWVR